MPPAGGNGPTRQSKAAELEAQAVLRLIGVAMLLRLLQSRRFWERLAVGGIVLGALGRMGQENRAGMMTRLAAVARLHGRGVVDHRGVGDPQSSAAADRSWGRAGWAAPALADGGCRP